MEGAGSEPNDRLLVARCRAGDAQAWNQLVERFSRYVYAICRQGFRLGNEDAEDVFQDVFAKVFTELARLRDDGAVRPWIAQLTRRACIDRLRQRRGTVVSEVEVEEPEGFADRLAELDQALDLRLALAGLPGACADILDRFFARDESYKTIGEALSLPAGTIASRISRCLEKLRAVMEDDAAGVRPVDG